MAILKNTVILGNLTVSGAVIKNIGQDGTVPLIYINNGNGSNAYTGSNKAVTVGIDPYYHNGNEDLLDYYNFYFSKS